MPTFDYANSDLLRRSLVTQALNSPLVEAQLQAWHRLVVSALKEEGFQSTHRSESYAISHDQRVLLTVFQLDGIDFAVQQYVVCRAESVIFATVTSGLRLLRVDEARDWHADPACVMETYPMINGRHLTNKWPALNDKDLLAAHIAGRIKRSLSQTSRFAWTAKELGGFVQGALAP